MKKRKFWYFYIVLYESTPLSFSTYYQGLREGDETDADHRGPRCLGKNRGPRWNGNNKFWSQDSMCFTHSEKI